MPLMMQPTSVLLNSVDQYEPTHKMEESENPSSTQHPSQGFVLPLFSEQL